MRSVLALALLFVLASPAYANPKPLPYSYTYPTVPEGSIEIEQYADIVPLKAIATSGETQWYAATQFQTELEYGISDHLELGLYVTVVPTSATLVSTSSLPEANGLKQRLRYRFAEEGEWPIDVGVYGEIVENEREVELEAKILLQRRFQRLTLVANLWAEHEWYFVRQRYIVLNPTIGASYQVTPTVHPGIEGWMRVEFPDPAPHPRPFSVGPHELVGPVVLFNFGRIWWSTGVYVRVDQLGRNAEVGDTIGSIWARTIVGVGF